MTQKVCAEGMPVSKGLLQATVIATNGPRVVDYPTPGFRPKQLSTRSRSNGIFSRVWRRFRHLFEPLQRYYKRLSWTTRQMIRTAITLVVLLYIFLTVPFRIAFYYDPYEKHEEHNVHRWTEELTVFTVLDAVTDIIGLVEFIRLYRAQHLSAFSRFSSFDLSRRPSRDSSWLPPTQHILSRTPSFNGLQRGKTKWTLASIERTSIYSGSSADDSVSQHHFERERLLEFVLEIVALVPVEIIPYAMGVYNVLHLVRFTKLARLYRLRRCLARIADIYSDRAWVQQLSSTGIDSLVRTITSCAGLCHWVACGYMLIAHVQCGISFEKCDENLETSWVIRDHLFGASTSRKYSRTLYWASRTMVLLGYDDVTPVSDAETIYTIFAILLGALFGSSLLATFLFIFRFRNARSAAFATHVDNAREYMRSQNIPRAVRRQVIAYYSYSWNTHHSLDSEEALHLMPKHLQSKVVSTLKASRLKQICFLVKESVEFINLLAAALTRQVYSPADPIIEPKLNAQMFFVIRGRVITSAFDGSNPKECQTGDFFADSCLLYPEKFEGKATAKTFCELYVLAKVRFDEAMTAFHRENEPEVRARMAATLEKYSVQLRKTNKLLGTRQRTGSGGRISHGGSSHSIMMVDDAHLPQTSHQVSWRFPGSVFRAHWDTTRLLAVIYVALEVPYFSVFISMTEDQHVFVEQPEYGLRYSITFLIELFFGANIILRSRYLAHLDPVAMLTVDDPDLIFAAYKNNGFYLDLVAWLPIGIILETLGSTIRQRYLLLFRLLRLLRLHEAPYLLWNVCDYYSVSSKVHIVISLVLGVIFMIHVVGCVWFEMAWIPGGAAFQYDNFREMTASTRPECLEHATKFDNCSWVSFDCYSHIGDVFPTENPDSMYQASFAYMRSVYWAMVTLTGVGYGDIVAYTTAESFFAALWTFVGGVINFGVVGAMSSTISNAMAAHHHHMEKINTLNAVLERMDISEKLSAEIRRFYHHEFTGRKQAYESKLLSNLPDQLCYQISSLLHADAVKSVSLFDSASISFLKEVTGKFRHRSFPNGETICLEGDVCREFFVFLHGSKVNVFFRSRKVPIRALHEGDSYGVSAFLLKQAHPATLTAASLVHASVMTREQFDVIQRKFDDDLKDMREEAQIVWIDQQKTMRRIVRNLEKLKLQPHLMQTSTLFYQGEIQTSTHGDGNNSHDGKRIRDSYATRNLLTSVWNAIITFWNVYNAIFVIFRICFHSHIHFSSGLSTAVWVADLSCDACFAVDIYLRLFYFGLTEVELENLISRHEMDRRYLRSSTFKWDLLTSFPSYYPFSSGSLTPSLCRLPRLIRCVDIWVYLDDAIVQIQQYFASHNVSAYLSPLKLMIILVLVAHYVGCIFFLISERECHSVENCWMLHDHLLHEYHHSVLMLYAKSFYWAITTLLLVGSRESVPRDAAGTLWTSFTCLCCTFIIGHIVGEISELILELGKESKQYKNRIASFEGFAKEHELPGSLRERVGFFYRLQFEHTKGLDIQHTMQDLSANLRLKFQLEIYGHAIVLMPISRFLTPSQVNNLALRLQSELFIPGDNILVEGSFGSRLCILRKGMAAASWTSSATTIAILMEGALFGEVAFFISGQRRLATVRSTTSCEVLYITRHHWQELWTSSDDVSDAQVQRHALNAIFEWVHNRLRRYQQNSLRAARKAKSLLATRQNQPRFRTTTSAASGTIKVKRRLSAALLAHPENSNESVAAAPAMRPKPVYLAQTNSSSSRRLSVASEIQLLEKKTKYLQAKTEECTQKYHAAIEAMYAHRRSSSMISTRSHRHSSTASSKGRGNSSGMYRSFIGDAVTPAPSTHSDNPGDDIRVLQFIVNTSPINRYIRDSLPDEYVQSIEKECWARFKLLAIAQHAVSKLVEEYATTDAAFIHTPAVPGQQAQIKIQPARNNFKLQRTLSFRYDEHADRKREVHSMMMKSSDRRSTGPKTSQKWKALAVAAAPKLNAVLKNDKGGRRFSTVDPQLLQQTQRSTNSSGSSEKSARLKRMTRCHSLPRFDREFYDRIRRDEDCQMLTTTAHSVADFETLRRCQRPQVSTQLRLFQRYHAWKDRGHATVKPELPRTTVLAISRRHLNDAIPKTPSTRETVFSRNNPRAAAVGSQLQLSSQQALRAATSELKAKEFIKLVKQVGKVWDLTMLLIAVYHLMLTPFKVCFSNELVELPDSVLRAWSGFEIFLDLLNACDVAHKVRQASLAAAVSSRGSKLRKLLSSNPALRTDIIAMLPLEVLLLVADFRALQAFEIATRDATHASWWITRWLLRLNRLLLVSRIEPLTEQLFQFIIYDSKLPVTEALLYFLRGLASYLTMGHLLACIWFLTSDLGYHQYGTSWLSTSGMLTFISTDASAATHEAARLLSVSTGTFVLEAVSLSRKYLRSLLFSMECISTLFYGDILSMNPMELVAEIVITFWSIYIYGALVGAQGEYLDARARREAAFEQKLGELQLYLVQNEVPKVIKRQVKAYYARLWRRRKGETEFAAVEKASRALYEEVVVSTLRSFAVQVRAFRALDDQFLRALLACLQFVVCSESEEVFVIGDMDRSMYFIAQGHVLVKMGHGESTRERGEFFGELALLYGISRLETCVATTVTELYRLDHEPYEHLLLEFPEYRARNKLAWTTTSSGSIRDRTIVEDALKWFRETRSLSSNKSTLRGLNLRPSFSLPQVASVNDIAANAERIDAQLPHSYIYRSAMEMLSKLNKVDPLEAKDLFLKSRDGARKQLKTALGVATARVDEEDEEVTDEVQSFHRGSADVEDRLSDSVDQMEAAVEELSTPVGGGASPRTETAKILMRGPSYRLQPQGSSASIVADG